MIPRRKPDTTAAPANEPGFAFQGSDAAMRRLDRPPPDVIVLARSPSLALWIVLAAACAAGLTMRYLPLAPGLFAGVVLALYGWKMLRLHAGQSHAASVIAMRYGESGISYQLKNGQWLNGRLLDGGLVNRWLTVLRLRDDSGRQQVRYILLTPDRISVYGFRVARRFMLWSRQAEDGA